MKNKVELLIKSGNSFVSVDVLDFPYRLNRVAFSTSSDKLKTLGGTTSTQIKLAKSKKNNKVFVGKTDFKSVGKFNNAKDCEAKIVENGAQSAIGILRIEGVTHKEYLGTFYDNDAEWVDRLAQFSLNEIGYRNGVPTWLVPFDGTITINEVNDLSNRETDFICPLIQYNNTPILDYLGLTNSQIFESGLRFPKDFALKNGFFGNRLGLNYNDVLPAVYYRNLIERIFAEVGLSVECPLFYEPWFNALYLPYVGNKEYQFNWKNIASVYSENPFVEQIGESEIDEIKYKSSDDVNGLTLFKDNLPLLNGSTPEFLGMSEVFRFKKAQVIKHDDPLDTLVEKISLVNNFNTFGYYEVQADGNYTIEVNSEYENRSQGLYQVFFAPSIVYFGFNIFEAFGAWDANSGLGFGTNRYQNHFGADDNVLVVLRVLEGQDFDYSQTEQDLFEWMNGQNTRFTDEKNDVIAYFSPKRYKVNQGFGGVAANQISGSPISNFEKQVELVPGTSSHSILFVTGPDDELLSRSSAHIKINCDLKKGERVEIFWIAIGNIEFSFETTPPTMVSPSVACDEVGVIQRFGTEAYTPEFLAEYSITYNCGTYDLDLAANLPKVTAKNFISSFIRQFNLHFFREGNTVQFTPVAQYYSPETYDITKRVDWDKGWESKPIATPKTWIVGYDVDAKDKLLSESFDICTGQNKKGASSYGNLTIENQNAYADGVADDTVLFSSTKFINQSGKLVHRTADAIFLPTETDPISGFVLQTGLLMPVLVVGKTLPGLLIPSIQSADSAKFETFGELGRSFDYTPRLLYHLGTANQFYGINEEYQILIGYPRAIVDGAASVDFIRKQKHWIRATVSQFDLENSVQTGIEYPTLRYDTANGLYSRYFENLIELFNLSEQMSIQVAVRASDWANLKGYKKIRFQDQLYRLMEVKDYDPVSKNTCIVTLLKEV
jgi:hypothetical protein